MKLLKQRENEKMADVSTNILIVKLLHSFHGILLNNEKEHPIFTHINVNESQRNMWNENV